MKINILLYSAITAAVFGTIFILLVLLYNKTGLNHFQKDKQEAIKKGNVVLAHRVKRGILVNIYQFSKNGCVYKKKKYYLYNAPVLLRLYYTDSPKEAIAGDEDIMAAVILVIITLLATIKVTSLLPLSK